MLVHNELKKSGKLKFSDVSNSAGVARMAVGFSAVAGDVNGDGLPDIYVTSYNHYGKVVPDSWFRATNGTKSLLFINQGNGKFREQAEKWGVANGRWAYAAEFVDIDGDGKLDLIVANDFGEKALYMNKGDHFVDEAKERGVLDPGNGMGVSVGDFNNDGLLDIQMTNMSSTAGNRILARLFPNQSPKDNVLKKLASGDSLYINTGKGYFRNATDEVGGLSASWAWGGGFIDFDNDGWEDLYIPCGFISGKSMKDT
jgi:FG-GAP-like repeat/FG-GAP repeat